MVQFQLYSIQPDGLFGAVLHDRAPSWATLSWFAHRANRGRFAQSCAAPPVRRRPRDFGVEFLTYNPGSSGGVMSEESARHSKKERREERRRDAQRRLMKKRLRRVGIAVTVLVALGLWAWEYSGPEELVEAEVIGTRRWRHQADDGSSHPHISATLKIEGLSEATLERADGYERGQRVLVWVRRGPISGRPYFLDVAKPGEIERQKRESAKGKTP
jgi:hypothetical protein